MALSKIILVTGDVVEFDGDVRSDYTSNWAKYEDANGNKVVDVARENLVMEVFNDDAIETTRLRDTN